MASFRTKFQIFGLLVSDKNKYNPFLRQQAWHCANRAVLCSKKNVNEDAEEPPPATSKGSERYGKRKKISRFLNFRRTSSKTRTDERSRIINCKTQKLSEQKLTFWEYVFSPKKSQTRRTENPQLCDPSYQATTGNTEISTEPVRSWRIPRNLEPQSSMYKVPRAVLLKRMIVDGFDEKNNNCEGKTMTFTMTRRPYEEMRPPSNFRRLIELRRDDVRSENKEPSEEKSISNIGADK